MNKSFKEANQEKIQKALSPYVSSRKNLRSKRTKNFKKNNSVVDSPRDNCSLITPFAQKKESGPSNSTVTTPRKSRHEEYADEPYKYNVTPESMAPVRRVSYISREKKESYSSKRESQIDRKTPIQSKNLRESKPVPLQTPVTIEEPENAEESKYERGWSQKVKPNFSTYDDQEDKRESLVQGDSFDSRKPSYCGNSKNLDTECQMPTTNLSTYDTRAELKRSFINSQRRSKPEEMKYKGHQQPFESEASEKGEIE